MLKRWAAWLHEGGVRGKHITLEPAGTSQVRLDACCHAPVGPLPRRRPRRSRAVHAVIHLLAAQEDIVVRYGDDADFDGPVMEFLMRQAEVSSALVRGHAITKAQYWANRPDPPDEL